MYEIDRVLARSFEHVISTRPRTLKSLKTNPLSGRLISNYNDVLLAVNEVYSKPFTPRIIKNHSRISRKDIDVLRGEVAKKIYNYFNREPNTLNNQANFDLFHNNLVKYFCSGLNALARRYGASVIEYGQGQKLINMVFKYLACYSDYSRYADLFSYCHIPIDSIVLQELGRLGVPHISISKKQYKGLSWSKLRDRDYLDLVNDYRTILHSMINPNLCWLSVDFIVWNAVITGIPIVFPMTGTSVITIHSFYS